MKALPRMSVHLRICCAALLLALGSAPVLATGADDALIEGSGPSGALHTSSLAPAYPSTRRDNLVETKFGTRIADPYRWLEDDARSDPEVAAWVAAQNDVTQSYLATLPGRDALRARMTALYDYERFGMPRKAGGRYFYTHNSGLQKQSALFVREGLAGEGRLLLDPAALPDASALAQWEPSADGRYLLYALQQDGSDWRTLRIMDVESGRTLPDRIERVRYSGLAWRADGQGFFYSGYDASPGKRPDQAALRDQRIWYHALGTPQSADRLLFATPDQPGLRHSARVADDGRWLVIQSSMGAGDARDVTLVPLRPEAGKPIRLVQNATQPWAFIGSAGDRLYFRTSEGAARGRILMFDASLPVIRPVELVPEQKRELAGASLVGERIILAYIADGETSAEMVDLAGQPVGRVPMPGLGTAAGFVGRSGDPETFFRFSDFTTPERIYRFDVATGAMTTFAAPRLPFDPDAFETVTAHFRSRDGTRVPLYLVRRKDVAASGKPAPTLLYGYGGFARSVTPSYSPTRMAWLEQGGVIAIAALRGGGEFGKAWHDAGRLSHKQNVFDDFIAAAEYLKAEGITGANELAIEGRSNGGLLVGAVLNQRPDLFAAALPAVGVMDMLRFTHFTAGRYWMDDYGNPDRKTDFRNLLSYSPYHNVRSGATYPAVLVTTADSDDRVVPAHSFKYVAALQHAEIGDRPHLILTETGAGHGIGTPIDKQIDEASDAYSFAAYWTGLKIQPK